MIVSFSVSNFRSFAGEQTLSMVASKRMADGHSTHLVAIPKTDESVLRAGVLYGPNGAGKSNLVRALSYFKQIALGKTSIDGRQGFRFGVANDGLTAFDLQFLAGERLFRYGVKLDDKYVREEWLIEVVGKRQSVVFERVTTADGKETEVRAPGIKRASDKLKALLTIGAPASRSFLGNVFGQMESVDAGDKLRLAIHWFDQILRVDSASNQTMNWPVVLERDPELTEFLSRILRGASTGVSSLAINRKPIQRSPVFRREELHDEPPHVLVSQKQLVARHEIDGQAEAELPFQEESDGTRRLLDLAPILYQAMKKDTVFVIDEIERNMHPNLVNKFVEFFLKTCTANNRQMIMTTHDVELLDQELIRRDEVWFAEKDANGATNLYSLADFNVRKDLHLRKNYLQGRFGAVPNLDKLGVDEAVAH